MSWQVRALVILIGVGAVAGAQTATETRGPVAGHWVDPATKLMWTAKDSGRDVKFGRAVRYCHQLRLAGYSDWRLPTLAELAGIYDKDAQASGENPKNRWHEAEPMVYHVKGDLFLTGKQWGNSQDRQWYFDFRSGEGAWDDPLFTYERALCVRRSGE